MEPGFCVLCYTPSVNNAKQKIVIIVGPTASGKTALSINLAQRFNGEVISADSRQVYRGLDIGTEKIGAADMDGVPHHLIDIVDPSSVYTAADWKRDAETAITEITSRGKLPIVAGGTFFYIDALMNAASLPEVPPDPEFREKMELLPAETLANALEKIDPRRAAEIDRNNKRRIIRALEIVKALGAVPEPLQTEEPYDALWIGLTLPKEALRARIRTRAEEAIRRGLVAETKQLLEDGVTNERLMEIGLEYPLAIEHIDGSITESELIQKLEEKNWQYAKRQWTWLKTKDQVRWIDRAEDAAGIVTDFLT